MPEPIYLDWNSTTPMREEVIERVAEVSRSAFANPSSRHGLGREAGRVLEEAREEILALLGAGSADLVFTSGGTEASNLALWTLARQSKRQGYLAPAGEHAATASVLESLAVQGWSREVLALGTDGRFLPLSEQTCDFDSAGFATAILAHNETGVLHDLGELSAELASREIPLHLDAVQAAGKIPVHYGDLGATTLAIAGHKFQGPRGIGAVVKPRDLELSPLLTGGRQEGGQRPGTVPTALAAGMALALQLAVDEMSAAAAETASLRDEFEQRICSAFPSARVTGAESPRLPGTAHITFPGIENSPLLTALDLEGIACSVGSTCSSGAAVASETLIAMGLPIAHARGGIRFSLGHDTTEAEVDDAVERIVRTVRRLSESQAVAEPVG